MAQKPVIRLAADQTTNDGEEALDFRLPYRAEVTIRGVADLLFHRWSNESVETKSKAAKGSKAKKTDDIESYVYRTDAGEIALPGEYLRQSIINAAKFKQDPRSPRKSAMDITKAAVISLTPLASLGVTDWDYLDKRRVVVQRSAVTRTRPAMLAGWEAAVVLMITLPEYIDETFLRQLIDDAGRLIGLGDFRPTYGRFSVVGFRVLGDED